MRPSLRVHATLWAVSAALTTLVCGACGFAAARASEAAGFGVLARVAAPAWAEALAAVLALDLVSYAWHRANHRVPFLWRFHRVHHADETFTATTAVRFHPGEILMSLPVRLAAIVALGPGVYAVLAFEVAYAAANVFEHADIDLPPKLERALVPVLVVPAFHRRHHSRRRAELDSNFATIFIVWDRWLGTYGASTSRDRYMIGLSNTSCRTGLRALLLPFRPLLDR
jgi:sterol desaturase/sphingolipid hydroxylase (fatty acid hydroxylase superfamily)